MKGKINNETTETTDIFLVILWYKLFLITTAWFLHHLRPPAPVNVGVPAPGVPPPAPGFAPGSKRGESWGAGMRMSEISAFWRCCFCRLYQHLMVDGDMSSSIVAISLGKTWDLNGWYMLIYCNGIVPQTNSVSTLRGSYGRCYGRG